VSILVCNKLGAILALPTFVKMIFDGVPYPTFATRAFVLAFLKRLIWFKLGSTFTMTFLLLLV
jgi:hypothetical protein